MDRHAPRIRKPKVRAFSADFRFLRTDDEIRRFVIAAREVGEAVHVLYATAVLTGMLVYAPGQFFVTHQDSEKSDDMIATLVVTLPSDFSGGEIVVQHHEEKDVFRGSSKGLGMIAFYADCHHEVRPVKSGYRIALTYITRRS